MAIGGYRLLKLLGAGRCGGLAEHERLGRRAAVKVLDGWDPELVSRLLRSPCGGSDWRRASGRRHDFVADPQKGVVAYVMEYLAGEDPAKLLQRERVLAPSRSPDWLHKSAKVSTLPTKLASSTAI